MIAPSRRRRWRDRRLPLFTLQPRDLIAQPLVLGPQRPVVGRHFLDQVQQPDDDLARTRIRNPAQIKVEPTQRRHAIPPALPLLPAYTSACRRATSADPPGLFEVIHQEVEIVILVDLRALIVIRRVL